MPVEMGLWRVDLATTRRLLATTLPSESALEDYLERDPTLLGEPLLVIGRQVRTPYNKFIDLLAMDADGNLHILELKRDKTPREVVAQLLDYGSWVTALTHDEVLAIAGDHLGDRSFEAVYAEVFDATPPDELNSELRMTIVATGLDAGSERIVTYLREFGVPINAVFFSYLEDDDRRYLARSWLTAPEESGHIGGASTKKGKRADWNGRDWFVSFGAYTGGRQWEDGRRYGFVSAGGEAWYSRTLRNVPTGARLNVCIPRQGYVAIGESLGQARRFDEVIVTVDGHEVKLADQALRGTYHHSSDVTDPDELAEWVIPVRWLVSRPEQEAYWETGMFANQNSACKLRQEFTLGRLAAHFRLDEDAG